MKPLIGRDHLHRCPAASQLAAAVGGSPQMDTDAANLQTVLHQLETLTTVVNVLIDNEEQQRAAARGIPPGLYGYPSWPTSVQDARDELREIRRRHKGKCSWNFEHFRARRVWLEIYINGQERQK